MKRTLVSFLVLALLLSPASGCGRKNGKTQPEKLPVPETSVLQESDFPAFIVSDHMDKTNENYYAFQLEHVLYLAAVWGKKPSGGYSINFVEYNENSDHSMDVYLITKSPGKNENVSTVITYPGAFVRFYPQAPVSTVRFHVDGKKAADVVPLRITAPVEEVIVELYFGSPNACLYLEPRPVPICFISASITEQAEILFRQLLAGSQSLDSGFRVIPDGTRLLDAAYDEREKLLIVTVSAEFANAAGSAGELLAVYSVVNTMAQIEGVDYVTIQIDGAGLSHMDQLEQLSFNDYLVEQG
ncbi:MAG: GerMN domain-containing protein [Dethiobacter sp.]|jgi:hypothetical protein|nr:GerMN domain-containing protein [Dethiobacter sp.]